MNLREFIHAPTRPAWTARLVAYIALVATLAVIIELVQLYIWWP